MNEEEFKESIIKRIGIKETIEKSLKLYKDNFKLFLTISLISFIIDFINSGFIEINRILSIDEYGLGIRLLKLLIFIVVIFYSCKITITLYLCIAMRYKNINTSIRYCYKNASDKVWRYIGVGFKLMLILIIPLIGLIIAIIIARGRIKYLGVVVMLIPFTYLAIVNGFAPIISVLEEEKLPYFKLSKKIVEGDFWRIVLLVFLTLILFNIPYVLYMYSFNKIKEISPHKKFIVSTINDIMLMFTCPFSLSAQVIMYFGLKEKTKELFKSSSVE